jgi:hypothetical protein
MATFAGRQQCLTGSGIAFTQWNTPFVCLRLQASITIYYSMSDGLLLVLPPDYRPPTVLQPSPQILIHRKRHRLSRRNTHHSRRDTLVERRRTFLLEHLPGYLRNPTERRLSRFGWRPLQTSLDGIDRRVGERSHGSRYQSNDGSLIRRELAVGILGLPPLQCRFEFGVSCEVGGLVCALSQCCERYAAIQGTETFFADDGEESVRCAAVFGCVERIGEGVVLGLETDFDDFHGVDDGHGFGYTCGKTGCEHVR